jgi:hypothetical protein
MSGILASSFLMIRLSGMVRSPRYPGCPFKAWSIAASSTGAIAV